LEQLYGYCIINELCDKDSADLYIAAVY
jgi:hypothetical protein